LTTSTVVSQAGTDGKSGAEWEDGQQPWKFRTWRQETWQPRWQTRREADTSPVDEGTERYREFVIFGGVSRVRVASSYLPAPFSPTIRLWAPDLQNCLDPRDPAFHTNRCRSIRQIATVALRQHRTNQALSWASSRPCLHIRVPRFLVVARNHSILTVSSWGVLIGEGGSWMPSLLFPRSDLDDMQDPRDLECSLIRSLVPFSGFPDSFHAK
jgi:hypothetical protein